MRGMFMVFLDGASFFILYCNFEALVQTSLIDFMFFYIVVCADMLFFC